MRNKSILALIFLFLCTPSFAGQEQKDIIAKKYTAEEVRSYFGEYLVLLKEARSHGIGDTMRLDVGTFKVKGGLGEGRFGVAYEIVPAGWGRKDSVALKLMEARESLLSLVGQSYIRPHQLLRTLDHPNVIGLEEPNSIFMIMEKADGTVMDIITGVSDARESFFQRAALDAIHGLQYLEESDIPFRDTNLGNLAYVQKDKKITFKWIDIDADRSEPFISKVKDFTGA